MGNLINGFTIGADPEFVAFDNAGRVVMGTEYFDHHGDVGWDHSGYVLELRPEPSRSSWLLLKNIKGLLTKAEGALTRPTWGAPAVEVSKFRAGAVAAIGRGRPNQPLGGHIHLDVNPFKPKESPAEGYNTFSDRDEDYDYSPYTLEHGQRMRGLDCFTDVLERLDILPNRECVDRRKSGQYGKFGQFRVTGGQVQGANWETGRITYVKSRTEYRTMPSWLFHPKVAFLCLTGAKLIAHAPQDCRALLGKGAEYTQLMGMFDAFKGKDINAKRAMEWIFEGKKLKDIQLDPNADFRPAWGEI